MPGFSADGGGSKWKSASYKDPIDGGGGVSARLSELREWMGLGEDVKSLKASDEESQGLLGMAQQGLQTAAERATGAIGGTFGASMGLAVQVASIGRERWLGFFVLLAVGCFLMAIAFASLPLIVLAPQKFSMVFTTGSLCFLASMGVLKGFSNLVTHLLSAERLSFSFGYLGSVAGTLWASLWSRSALLTMVFSVLQITQLMWFLVSYIPGGSAVLGVVCDALKSGMRQLCCGCAPQSRSLPL